MTTPAAWLHFGGGRVRTAERASPLPLRPEHSMSTPSPVDLDLDFRPALPRRKDFRIGCVGAGFIMADCHLVAYRQAGFNPVAIASQRRAKAAAVAQRIAARRAERKVG